MNRNIGLKIKSPKNEPGKNDKKNPFNGTLSNVENCLKEKL